MDCGFYKVIWYCDWQSKSSALAAFSLVWIGIENVACRHLALYLRPGMWKKSLSKEKRWQLQNPELSVKADRDLRSSTDSLPALQLFLYFRLVFSLLLPVVRC